MMQGIFTADTRIAIALDSQHTTPVRRVLVSSDLLYQAHHALFPAERMLVVAGRQCGDVVMLGAVFDVTGTASTWTVRADPIRLARALIAMDMSGTYLAGWIHSHPGNGAQATWPSSTDLQQHQDWIRDYTVSLLSAIVVADGWVRLWGNALESRQIVVEIIGEGISKEEQHDWLFRLTK
jgi:proteasome lid subunit RPN8/RPN11